MTDLTNNELVIKEIIDKIVPKNLDLNDCVRFPSEDGGYMFYNSKTNKVTELSFDRYFRMNSYTFDGKMSSMIMKSKRDNRYICIDWQANEIMILSYILDQHGIKNFMIKELPYKENKKVSPNYKVHEMIFSDDSDSSMFELYFNHFFHDHEDKEFIREIIKNNKLFE